MKRFLLAGVMMVGLATWARAESKTMTVRLEAGDHDRVNVPVCVSAETLGKTPGVRSATVKDEDGKTLPAQVTGASLLSKASGDDAHEVHFILPKLKKGASTSVKVTLSDESPSTSGGFSWKQGKAHDDLMLEGDVVLRYEHPTLDESDKESRVQTYKPYHHLFDGPKRLTKGPGGLYTHHRGIFYGFNKVTYDGDKHCDVWHCTGKAFQEPVKTVSHEAGAVLGRHVVEIKWHGQDGEPFAVEHRELTVYNVPGGRMVGFASKVEPAQGVETIHLDGDPQHAGFHFRADQEVAGKNAKQTTYVRPDGVGKPGETRNWDPKTQKGPVNLSWNAMSFVLGDQRYTVAYLDRPGNPKEARFSERDYGRFGSYFVYDVTKEKPLEVSYRLWEQKGQMTPEQVAEKDSDFEEPVKVTKE